MVYLSIYVSDNCRSCEKVVNSTKKIIHKFRNVHFQVLNINECKKFISIVPAIYVDNELFCYGEIDDNKLSKFISAKQSNNNSK